MKPRLSIGIDLDEVCADFCGAFRRDAQVLLQREIVGPRATWEMPKDWNISEAEIDGVWKRIRQTKNWWETLGKLPDTDLLSELDPSYQPIFITSRIGTLGRSVEDQSARWIQNCYGIEYPCVIVRGTGKKGLLANALDLFAFVDDKVENIKDVEALAPTCRRMCFLCGNCYPAGLGDYYKRVPNLNSFIERLP